MSGGMILMAAAYLLLVWDINMGDGRQGKLNIDWMFSDE